MTASSFFFHQNFPTNKLMQLVCAALIPGLIVQFYFFGFGVLVNVCWCVFIAIASESLVLKMRGRPLTSSLADYSAVLSGMLLGLAIPPLLPFWMSLVGVSFAIIFAKQLYGGLGFNPFNPAMVGYLLLLISFPQAMTAWLPPNGSHSHYPDFAASLQLTFLGETTAGFNLLYFRQLADGFTMATPLDYAKTARGLGKMSSEIANTDYFSSGLLAWLWINMAYLLGGILLLMLRIIRWHIPLSMLASIAICSIVLNYIDPERYNSTWWHLMSGATMLGAFFIATDPVSAATTSKGRVIYGALIGFWVIIIRTFGGYPEAIAFAVLLTNIASPTIDYYCKPVVYGKADEN